VPRRHRPRRPRRSPSSLVPQSHGDLPIHHEEALLPEVAPSSWTVVGHHSPSHNRSAVEVDHIRSGQVPPHNQRHMVTAHPGYHESKEDAMPKRAVGRNVQRVHRCVVVVGWHVVVGHHRVEKAQERASSLHEVVAHCHVVVGHLHVAQWLCCAPAEGCRADHAVKGPHYAEEAGHRCNPEAWCHAWEAHRCAMAVDRYVKWARCCEVVVRRHARDEHLHGLAMHHHALEGRQHVETGLSVRVAKNYDWLALCGRCLLRRHSWHPCEVLPYLSADPLCSALICVAQLCAVRPCASHPDSTRTSAARLCENQPSATPPSEARLCGNLFSEYRLDGGRSY